MPETILGTNLSRPTSYTTPKHNADVVMKGGITSGIVFPLALCELARAYRFRNIGGTSAGAIAAGFAAAAEYGRATKHFEGLAELAKLPMWLGGRDPGQRRGRMLNLFQPQPETRSLFELLLLLISPSSPLKKTVTALGQVVFPMGVAPWLGLAPGLLLALFLALSDRPASTVALGVAAALWLLAAAVGLALLSLPVARGGGKKALLGAGVVGGAVIIILGPVVWQRSLDPALSMARHTWALEGALLLAVLGLLVGSVVALARILVEEVPANGFGLSSGNTVSKDSGPPALTPWLHEQIQEFAGRSATDPPLTFHDLETMGTDKAVRLRVMTTCLTLGRPYLLPFETKIFYFDVDEMRRLFPGAIVDYLVKEADRWSAGQKPQGEAAGPFDYPENADYTVNRYMYPKRPLPLTKLPIVVAVRMSLSFPLLLSAVSLWAIDWRKQENQEADRGWKSWCVGSNQAWQRGKTSPGTPLGRDADKGAPPTKMPTPERCWFSDGGICSNFPVHLFDQLLPRWPTFAINLKYRRHAAERTSRVELARSHTSGLLQPWDSLAGDGANGPGSVLKFLGAILGTMQNWTDNSMLRVPGYRDRVVHLHLAPEEGGMNLDMTPEQVGNLARWGQEAGAALSERFTHEQAQGSQLSWDNHRWTRLRSSLSFLQQELEELVSSYRDSGRDGWRSYAELIDRAAGEAPTSYQWKWVGQTALAADTFQALENLVDLWNKQPGRPGFRDDGRPKPLPRFHIRPPLQM